MPRDKDGSLQLSEGYKVDGRWSVKRKLGQGSFGAVYLVLDSTNEFAGRLALKLESNREKSQVLKIEVAVLQAMQGEKHACKLYSRGRNNRYNFMVMSLLGPALSDLRKKAQGSKLSLATTTRIIFQCVKALRDMHTCGWIHRDVKPSNFCMGTTDESRRTVFIFDFGLARRYRTDGNLRPSRTRAGFRGTLRYCSLNAHRKLELGTHDDLVSLLYMTVEFVKGSVPWSKLKEGEEVQRSKESAGTNIYKDLPTELCNLHTYLYSLPYDKGPKYSQVEETLLKIIYTNKFNLEFLDWEKGPPEIVPKQPDSVKLVGEEDDDYESEDVEDLPDSNFAD